MILSSLVWTYYQRATDGLNGASKPIRKRVPASAAGSTSSNLCEPAISGITVVSAQTLLSAMRQSLCQQQTPLPAATHWPLSQLARYTTPTCTMTLGTGRNRAIRCDNKSIHSKHFITEKRSEKCRLQLFAVCNTATLPHSAQRDRS